MQAIICCRRNAEHEHVASDEYHGSNSSWFMFGCDRISCHGGTFEAFVAIRRFATDVKIRLEKSSSPSDGLETMACRGAIAFGFAASIAQRFSKFYTVPETSFAW